MKTSSSSPLRLLFITRHSPLPGEHGSGEYVFDLLRFLSSHGFEIDCLWVNRAINRKRGWCLVPASASEVYRLHAPGYFRVGRLLINPKLLLRQALKWPFRALLQGKASRKSARWNAPASSTERAAVAAFAARMNPDVLLANYYWMTATFPRAAKDPVRAVIAHDVFHQRDRDMRAAQVGVNCEEISAFDEARNLGAAELVLAITNEDAAVFRKLLPKREILVVPKAAEMRNLPSEAGVPGRCLFVAGESAPNVDGIDWFLREVWPEVIGRAPEATLSICGKVCGKLNDVPRGVILRGMVNDLAKEYAEAAAVIVPLRAGSGMKIKLVEALAHGRACVSTSAGLQGLGFLTHGHEVWHADDPHGFADGVVSLLRDEALRTTLQASGHAAVANYLAAEKTYGGVAGRLKEMVSARRAPAAPDQPLVSVVINNYNYARYLGAAIESALAQTYSRVETIVVDDGSTDESSDVIARFDGRITPISKSNGGQGSALNAGFAASSGEIVIFLDSDDMLHPDAVERIVAGWNPQFAKLHFRLTRLDRDGREIGTEPRAGQRLPEGKTWPAFLRHGRYVTPATSGSAYARWALQRVMPMPAQPYVYAADAYLNNSVVFQGPLGAIQEPLGVYRVHGSNDSLGNVLSADVKRVRYLMAREHRNDAVFREQLYRLGITGKSEARYRYYQRLKLRTLSWKIDPLHHPKQGDDASTLAAMALHAVWKARGLSLKERLLQTVWFSSVLLFPATAVTWLLSRGGAIKRLVKPLPSQGSAPLRLPSHAA